MGGDRVVLCTDRWVMVTLPGQPWAVSAARRCLAGALAARGHGEAQREPAELLASEVVTNALLHTASERMRGAVWFEIATVADGGDLETSGASVCALAGRGA